MSRPAQQGLAAMGKVTCAFAPALALLLLAFVGPASAQTPMQEPSETASYGPLAVCIGNHAVKVHQGEAAHRIMLDQGRVEVVSLIREDARSISFRTGRVETVNRPHKADDITLASGLVATRYSFDRWEGYRAGIPGEAVWSSEQAHRQYQFPGADGHPPVVVQAAAFADRDAKNDAQVLSRIVPRAGADCASLDQPGAPGAVPLAATFTPQTIEGPTRFCSGQLGIALRAGEQVRVFWPFDQRIAPMWLFQDKPFFMQIGGGPPGNQPVPNGPFLAAGFTQSRYPDGSGSAWRSPSSAYAFGDGSPLTINISHPRGASEQVDAVMGRLTFFRRGIGCDVQAMPAP